MVYYNSPKKDPIVGDVIVWLDIRSHELRLGLVVRIENNDMYVSPGSDKREDLVKLWHKGGAMAILS